MEKTVMFVPIDNCAQWEHHKGIEEVSPGMDGKSVMRKVEEIILTAKHIYDIHCTLPTRIRANIFASLGGDE